jgi:transglutaminase-like putative cysteine protease
MKKLLKIIVILLIALSWLVTPAVITQSISAQEEDQPAKAFENSLTTTYTVQTNGDTLVQHSFTIKNLTPTYYVSRHGLRISSPNIKSVKVSDSRGEIQAEVTHTDNQTNIGITFSDDVVGEGKVRQFTITYLNPDLAQIHGRVLEVAIPKQADPTQYDHTSVILNTPFNYGEPARVTPESNYSVTYRGGQVQLTFNDLAGRGVSAIYGTEQVFDLKFRYFLENNDSQPVLMQVALPPDTAFQRLNYQTVEPKPREIELDEDGNWIATFYMDGNTAQTVDVTASVLLTLEPNQLVPISQPQAFDTQAQPFWEIGNSTIQKLAKEYTTPNEIYDFVVSTLQYSVPESVDQLKRQGAAQALATPSAAACQEFSDLFVTLARANGIPARVVTGYAYTENNALRPLSLVNDILHAWPEYWDEEKGYWQPIDPTWENTTGGVDYFNQFDLNHIVLAINGKSSSLPYPAGSYKNANQTEKTLEVTFGTGFPVQRPAISIALAPQHTALAQLPGFYELKLENTSGAAWYDVSFDLTAEHSQVKVFGDTHLSALLPYQTVTIPLFVYNTGNNWLGQDQLKISVKVKQDTVATHEAEITNAPQFAQYLGHPYAFAALGAVFIFVALGAGSLLVLRRKR